MDPLMVTFWRCVLGASIFIPLVLIRKPRFYRTLTGGELSFMVLAGLALAVHFITLMEGLYQVSLGVALAVISTSTIWIGLLGVPLLRQALTGGQWAGLIVGLSGILLFSLVGGAFESSLQALTLLLLSAVALAFYFVTGQKIRATTPNITYVAIVYLVAALMAFLYAILTDHSLAVETKREWSGIFLITFFGQIMVHTVTNLYLRHGRAAFLKLFSLIQIPILSLAGWVLFDQRLGVHVLPALALILGGLIIFILAPNWSSRITPASPDGNPPRSSPDFHRPSESARQ
jgi:drug/metabolite transporter (DMT)-like permease